MWLIERVVDDAPTEGKAAISQCGPAFDEHSQKTNEPNGVSFQ